MLAQACAKIPRTPSEALEYLSMVHEADTEAEGDSKYGAQHQLEAFDDLMPLVGPSVKIQGMTFARKDHLWVRMKVNHFRKFCRPGSIRRLLYSAAFGSEGVLLTLFWVRWGSDPHVVLLAFTRKTIVLFDMSGSPSDIRVPTPVKRFMRALKVDILPTYRLSATFPEVGCFASNSWALLTIAEEVTNAKSLANLLDSKKVEFLAAFNDHLFRRPQLR